MKYKNTSNKGLFKKLSLAALATCLSVTGLLPSASSVWAAEETGSVSESVSDKYNTDQDTVVTDDASLNIIQDDPSAEPFPDDAADSSKNTTDRDDSPTDSSIVNENNSYSLESNFGTDSPNYSTNGDEYIEDQDAEKKEAFNSSEKTSGAGASGNTGLTAKLNGWRVTSGKYYYYKNNTKYTGWHYMTSAEGEKKDHWSYFGSDGALRTGWVLFGKDTSEPDGNSAKHWSYFGDNGWLRTGWVQLGKGTSEPDGNSAKHWSYFGDNGWLRTGWLQLGKGTSEPDGNSAKHWSYFGDNGWLRSGWVQLGKGTSEPDGNSAKHWSYFGDNGWLRSGWVLLGKGTSEPDGNSAKHWSYFGDNGWLRTFWQHLGQGTENPDGNTPAHFSYFGSNGWLVTGTRTIDGKSYTFDNKGWLIQGSASLSDANDNIGVTSTATAPLIADGCYRISPVKNTKYSIDVWGESAADKTKIGTYASNGTSAQFFQIKHLGNNIYSIKTGPSIYGSGWDISGGKAVAGSAIVQNKYTGSSTQKWNIVSAKDGSYAIKPAGSSLAADVTGKLSEGTLKLAKYTGSETQRFKITKTSGFLVRNGRKYYFNQNGDKPMIGLDVSAWSETIDWEKVKADGIEFAIIRTAHRNGRIDPYGARNMSECTRLGIPFGVYCYSYATTNAEADHEVDVLLSTLKGYNPQLGVFIDVEDNDVYSAAFGNIYSDYARRKITDIAKRMVSRVQNAGYLAGIYGNDIYLNKILYLDEMPNARWVAKYYTNSPSDTNVIDLAGKGYNIWQFTSKGTVKGLPNSGWADLNTLIEKYW